MEATEITELGDSLKKRLFLNQLFLPGLLVIQFTKVDKKYVVSEICPLEGGNL